MYALVTVLGLLTSVALSESHNSSSASDSVPAAAPTERVETSAVENLKTKTKETLKTSDSGQISALVDELEEALTSQELDFLDRTTLNGLRDQLLIRLGRTADPAQATQKVLEKKAQPLSVPLEKVAGETPSQAEILYTSPKAQDRTLQILEPLSRRTASAATTQVSVAPTAVGTTPNGFSSTPFPSRTYDDKVFDLGPETPAPAAAEARRTAPANTRPQAPAPESIEMTSKTERRTPPPTDWLGDIERRWENPSPEAATVPAFFPIEGSTPPDPEPDLVYNPPLLGDAVPFLDQMEEEPPPVLEIPFPSPSLGSVLGDFRMELALAPGRPPKRPAPQQQKTVPPRLIPPSE